MTINIAGYTVQISEQDRERIQALAWHVGTGTKAVYFEHSQYSHSMRRPYVIALHRFIMGCTYKDGCIVDHINGDTLDNRRENLRIVTAMQNTHNQRARSNSTGYKGVTRSKGRYKARIMVNYKTISLGSYATAEEAHSAYIAGARLYYGEYAREMLA